MGKLTEVGYQVRLEVIKILCAKPFGVRVVDIALKLYYDGRSIQARKGITKQILDKLMQHDRCVYKDGLYYPVKATAEYLTYFEANRDNFVRDEFRTGRKRRRMAFHPLHIKRRGVKATGRITKRHLTYYEDLGRVARKGGKTYIDGKEVKVLNTGDRRKKDRSIK